MEDEKGRSMHVQDNDGNGNNNADARYQQAEEIRKNFPTPTTNRPLTSNRGINGGGGGSFFDEVQNLRKSQAQVVQKPHLDPAEARARMRPPKPTIDPTTVEPQRMKSPKIKEKSKGEYEQAFNYKYANSNPNGFQSKQVSRSSSPNVQENSMQPNGYQSNQVSRSSFPNVQENSVQPNGYQSDQVSRSSFPSVQEISVQPNGFQSNQVGRSSFPNVRENFTKSNKFLESSGDDGFDMAGKIESTKSGVIGLLAGGIYLAPFSAMHNIFIDGGEHIDNGVAQWEFDTFVGSFEGALFAIVYRYCIRTDDNPMLNQGCIGAFVLVRTLSKIQIPSYCSAVPLDCGNPLGYFDWDMISQAGLSGLESAALFGAAALAMDYCFENKLVSKFRC